MVKIIILIFIVFLFQINVWKHRIIIVIYKHSNEPDIVYSPCTCGEGQTLSKFVIQKEVVY